MSHNMLTALTTRLTGACLLIVLSGHTNADYTEEEIREAAIWIDSMTTEIAQVNTTYKVQELKCYSKNITPSTSPKFFSLTTTASKYLQADFGKSHIRLKCGHVIHQVCLFTELKLMNLKKMYTLERQALCKEFRSAAGTCAIFLTCVSEADICPLFTEGPSVPLKCVGVGWRVNFRLVVAVVVQRLRGSSVHFFLKA